MDDYNHNVIGCIVCRVNKGNMPYCIPAPYVSLDTRVDARAHEECYWMFVNIMRVVLRLPMQQQ